MKIRRLAIRTGMIMTLLLVCLTSSGQLIENGNAGPSIATPRPINPASSTTNPSARATQIENPYLGSVPTGKITNEAVELTLQEAIDRGLKYNLGLIDTVQTSADVKAERMRALAALLPNISARAEQTVENISYKEAGIKFPPIPGVGTITLPANSGTFGFQDVRVLATQSIFNAELQNKYKVQKLLESVSVLNTKDARDVVVFAVGAAFFQVIASAARVEMAKAELISAEELDNQIADQLKAEVSPEIDAIRAQVERQTSEQRLINANNDLEKYKLTLGRITGLPLEQQFNVNGTYDYSPLPVTAKDSVQQALKDRYDLASASENVRAAEVNVRAEKSQRLPSLALIANYGGGGTNVSSFSHLYTVTGTVSIPIYTGGRIKADIDQAQAGLVRRRSEYRDLEGRVGYDVRVAQLDLRASESSIKVALHNKELATRALVESQDRYINGVANYLEVVQAREVVAASNENYVESLFSFNVSKIALARAMGGAETRIQELFRGN